ncbi:MAG: hypothetical protein PHH12_02680, partial [Candidatus Shapirobacteria bacterium]|nr:hypothetical protein [Candidatus Shapirobacteria bacterium]
MKLEIIFNHSKFSQYAAFLKSTNLSDASIQRKLSSLSSFQKFLVKKKLINPSPTPSLDRAGLNQNSIFKNIFKKINIAPLSRGAVHRTEGFKLKSSFLFRYLSIFLLFAIGTGLGFTLYRQAFVQSQKDLAYSTAASPVSGGRFLSFQGRLTDSDGNPITSSTGIVFKLFNIGTTGVGTTLYTSETGNSQAITPDDNGIFSVTIGKSHGTTIPSSVFSENAEVWLEITAGGEVMNPRQPIATVAYALNSETLQGLPPSASGLKDTVLVIDGDGNLNLGETSPTIKSISGTMGIEGQAVLIKASDGSGGNIEINPDSNGIIKLTTEGTGSTAVGGFVNLTNANLSTGNLINASINNTNRGYNFISLNNYNVGTSQLATRFSIDAYGNTFISNNLTIGGTFVSVGSTNLVTNLNANYVGGLSSTKISENSVYYVEGNTSGVGGTWTGTNN